MAHIEIAYRMLLNLDPETAFYLDELSKQGFTVPNKTEAARQAIRAAAQKKGIVYTAPTAQKGKAK